MGKAWFTDYPHISKEFENLKIIDSPFVKGWWTNHKDEPIKRAIYGQDLKFHIQMDKKITKAGDKVFFSLYNEVPNDKWDILENIYTSSVKRNPNEEFHIVIGKDHKVVIDLVSLSKLKKYKEYQDDNFFELYFWVTYKDTGISFPKKKEDYLKLDTIVIDRYKMPGLDPEGIDIAEDMAYGRNGTKHSKKVYPSEMIDGYIEIYKRNGLDTSEYDFMTNENISNLKPFYYSENDMLKDVNGLIKLNIYSLKDKEALLWYYFRTLKSLLTWGQLSPVLDKMIDKFKRNEGGIFEHSALTENIKNAGSTKRYCNQVEKYIAENIKNKFSKLEEVEDIEIDWGRDIGDNEDIRRRKDKVTGGFKNGKKLIFTTPLFPYNRYKENNLFSGRTLALNDIWATEVILKDLKFKEDNYTATYKVTLWDHFGLDKSDLIKFGGEHQGFVAWFILQHLHSYKPFVTKITFEKSFSCDLSTGRKELIERENIQKLIKTKEKSKKAGKWAKKEIEKLRRQNKLL